jgi:hypothetical protein
MWLRHGEIVSRRRAARVLRLATGDVSFTGHRTRSVFDRYSISSEGQKLDALRDLAAHQVLKLNG